MKPKTQTICIRLEEKQVTHLKDVARQLSVKQSSDIRYTDLIREAVKAKFPPTKDQK